MSPCPDCAALSHRLRQLEVELAVGGEKKRRIDHLNAVLTAVRAVSRLIIKENRRQPLIQGICESLIDTRGFYNAWIILHDTEHGVIASAEAGMEHKLDSVLEGLRRGCLPHCFQCLERSEGLVVIENPLDECEGCDLARVYEDRGAMSALIAHHGRRFGVLTVSVPTMYTRDMEERELFRDVANDIGFALHGIEVEEARRQGERALVRARDELERRVKERTLELELLSSRLLNAQEEERKRIAADLHDGVGQCLTAVTFIVESGLDALGKKLPFGDLKSLAALVPLLRETSEEVRTISMNLRPSILDDLGLVMTIGWLSRQFRNLYPHIRMEEIIEVTEEEVPDALKIVLFRILQEALTNVVKHSGAGEVRIFLGRRRNTLTLRVADDGRGCERRRTRRSAGSFLGGSGITGMKERAELSGGQFSLKMPKTGGTEVRAKWNYSCPRKPVAETPIS